MTKLEHAKRSIMEADSKAEEQEAWARYEKERKMKAWYFSTEDKKLRYYDNREIRIGEIHTVDGKIVACKNGLHGSVNILDALEYAPGHIVWQVELSGDMDTREGKIAARSRKYLSGGIDISDTLREFARWCALQVIDLWDAPDVVREYLETGKEELRDATWAAARDATWAATWAVTWAAAWEKQYKKLEEMVREVLND